jgi:hypothetical protein
LLFLLAPAIALAQEPTRVEVTKDNSIVLLSGEIKLNAGSSGQIRIKGNQHLVAMMFDAAALHYLTPGDSPGANYHVVKSVLQRQLGSRKLKRQADGSFQNPLSWKEIRHGRPTDSEAGADVEQVSA